MHRRVSVRIYFKMNFCSLLANDHQTRHPNEVSRATLWRKYTANIVFRSMQNSLSNQTTCNEAIRSDLEEIRSRLAVVETAVETMTKEGEKTTAEGHRIGRTLRS